MTSETGRDTPSPPLMVVVEGPDAVGRGTQNLALQNPEAELKDKVELAGADGSDVTLAKGCKIKLVPHDRTLQSISERHPRRTIDASKRLGAAHKASVPELPEGSGGDGHRCRLVLASCEPRAPNRYASPEARAGRSPIPGADPGISPARLQARRSRKGARSGAVGTAGSTAHALLAKRVCAPSQPRP